MTHYRKHVTNLTYRRGRKYNVSHFCLDNYHSINNNSIKSVKNVYNNRYFNAYESLEISKYNNLMHSDKGSIPFSPLYNLLTFVLKVVGGTIKNIFSEL